MTVQPTSSPHSRKLTNMLTQSEWLCILLDVYLTYLFLPAPAMQQLIKIVVPKVKAEWQYVPYTMGYIV